MYFPVRAAIGIIVFSMLAGTALAYDDSLYVHELGSIGQPSLEDLWDVWGWYDSENDKYYALVCDMSWGEGAGGLTLIETTDPENPTIIGTLTYGTGHHHVGDVKVMGDYAYATNEHNCSEDGAEIWIYYLPNAAENPEDPPENVLVLSDDENQDPDVPINSCHNIFVTEDHLFLAEGYMYTGADKELAVLAISGLGSPDDPYLLDVWDGSDFDPGVYYLSHDCYAIGDTVYHFVFGSGVYRIEFDGADGSIDQWTKIWYDRFRGDVVNNYPYGIHECTIGPETYPLVKKPHTHSGWLSGDGQYVLVADEGGNEIPAGCNDLTAPCLRVFNVEDFWDISDPNRDTLISLENAFDVIWDGTAERDKYYVGASEIDQAAPDCTPCPDDDCFNSDPYYITLGIHNPVVKGRLVFNSWYSRNLQILDVNDMSDMRHAGFLDRETGSDGDWKGEAFGVYPFSPDGYIYTSGDGFHIYRYGYTGLLDTSTTWAGDIYIYDTLTVADTARLAIESGTLLYMFEDALLLIKGTLVATGTVSDSVKFIVLGGNPQPGDWKGIYIDSSAACTLSYCSITKANVGIHMTNGSVAQIASSNISENDKDGIYVVGGSLTIDNSTLNENSRGIYMSENSSARVEQCNFGGNGSSGVFNYQGILYLERSDFKDNTLYGHNGYRSLDSIYNCTFSNSKYGIKYYGNSVAIIESCSVVHPAVGTSYYGIYVKKFPQGSQPTAYVRADSVDGYDSGGILFDGVDSDGIIENSRAVSCGTYGAYLKNTSCDILGGTGTKNLFQNNTYGLYLTNSSSPVVRRSDFKNNGSRGAEVNFGCFPDFGMSDDSGFNSFIHTSPPTYYYDLYNWNITSVSAIGNWWNEDPPISSQIMNAIYKPYLTSYPPKTGVELVQPKFAEDFEIASNYPNPFNPSTTILFNLVSDQRVSVRIYNIMGQEVRTVLDDFVPAGEVSINWNGKNRKGEYVAPGVYLCQLRTAEKCKTIKLIALK